MIYPYFYVIMSFYCFELIRGYPHDPHGDPHDPHGAT